MPSRTRIAPTPSGYLHAGNGAAFLLTSLLARMHKASLRLRIDDLDAVRMRPAYVQDIFDSLHWLGIAWQQGPADAREQERSCTQGLRLAEYEERISTLKEQGDLYACTCSRSRLQAIARQGSRSCGCRDQRLPFSRPDAVWRLHLPEDALVRMRQLHAPDTELRPAALLGDPVIKQRASDGGRPAYQIASLVDDVEHGIDFIVRGQDLLPSTACQLHLAERLGMTAFAGIRFVHHELILDADGRKLSKSEGAASLVSMRREGRGPDALLRRAEEMLAAIVSGS